MKSRRNPRARKNKTIKGGCMPEAFVSQPWEPGGPYAKPRPGELIRKLNTGLRIQIEPGLDSISFLKSE
jgi:hypothetical protein